MNEDPGGSTIAVAPSGASTPGAVPGADASWSQRLTARIEGGVCEVGETRETRQRKVQFTFAAMLVVPAGVVWGLTYLLAGEPVAAVIPMVYAAITLAGLVLLLRTSRFERFRLTQQAAIFVLPIALHLELGGFVGSSGVIVWSFLAVLMAVLFGGAGPSRAWFGAFVIGLVAVAIVQPDLAVENRLPPAMVIAFFPLNLGTVGGIVFVVLYSFLADRRRLREIEVAYLEQEIALRQSEKLAALGTQAAGMAHELNNAATAASRGVAGLRTVVTDLHGSMMGAVAGASPAHEAAFAQLRSLLRRRGPESPLSTLEKNRRVDELDDWLAELRLSERGGPAADALVERGFTRAELERVTASMSADVRRLFVLCLAASFATSALLGEVGGSVTRISRIVEAMRSYSYLDRGEVQEVDVVTGLEDTLLLLLGEKGTERVAVRRDFEPVPRVQGNGSQLNQVWTHLIQNALDAMNGRGTLTLRTRHGNGQAIVEVEDDGPGMPPETAVRVFDPFFTTKPPGSGTGLGLTVAHSIVVRQHDGRITVASEPGRTVFTVALPVHRGNTSGGGAGAG